MSTPSRNAPCSCGSGRRFKDCHGRIAADAPLAAIMRRALAAQLARRLAEAEALYRDALALSPEEPDALHMLGVIRMERGDLAEAKARILRALDLTGWRIGNMRVNLGLALSLEDDAGSAAFAEAMRARYEAMVATRTAARRAVAPRVSVVVPCCNHARFIERALRSVYAQSYRDLELVVLDDGSDDDSRTVIERTLHESPFPHRFVARDNRGAPATLNEGLALAQGDFVQFLNSDDALAPDRIARMVEAVAGVGAEWGFSGVEILDADDRAVDPMRERRAYDILCAIHAVPFRETVGFALVTENVAVSSGNLFVARGFAARQGGFRGFRYNHDWDFCLRALRVSEPVFVPEPLYHYRLHGANTITEASDAARAEAHAVSSDYLDWALADPGRDNPFAPSLATYRALFTRTVLRSGMGGVLDPELLRRLAIR